MKPLYRNGLLLTALALLAVACVAETSDPPAAMAEFLLPGTDWRVEDIAGGGVVDNTHTTIGFDTASRVSGDTACNRYQGTFTLEGARVSFGPMAVTRRACPPAIMDQETRFLEALGRVTRWEVASSGLLHLQDEDGTTVLRAFPTDTPE